MGWLFQRMVLVVELLVKWTAMKMLPTQWFRNLMGMRRGTTPVLNGSVQDQGDSTVYLDTFRARNQKIDMTVPVMNTVSEKGKEMCFYLTQAFQSNPPQPSANGVYVVQKKAMNVYATTMGGYPNMSVESRNLREKLERGRASQVDFSSYMSMSYDSPWKVVNRRNDVLYKKL